MDNQTQRHLFRAMENPSFYPHHVSGIRRIETHISKVFLTGEYVYKIKKPLDLGFLDFSDLEKRRYYCCREIVLNRRLTSDIYIDVVAITRNNGGFAIGGKGEPVEYAVRMRQLNEETSLQQLIKVGEINKMDMVALGRTLAQFYLQTAESQLLHTGEGWKTVYDACKGNFSETHDSCRTLLNRETWETVQGATLSFLKNRKSDFNHRFNAGKIRDCHGDLRCDHIYFTNSGIQIIDCIEFNDYLRHIDVICDLAFLLMDLDFNGESGLGDCVLNEFLGRTKDLSGFLMLPFYKCYRAMVRCKINCIFLRSTNLKKEERESIHLNAIKYLDLAFQYALQFFRPRIWVICGMPASGKSTIAKELSKVLGIRVIRSDVVRKEIFGLQPHESGIEIFGEKIYSSQAGSLTYGKLLCLAQEEIEQGHSVIIDATYSRVKHRGELLKLAKEKGIKPVFVECSAKKSILKERLQERQFRPSTSDAGIDHFEKLTVRYERFRYAGNALHIPVNTALPLEDVVKKILIQGFRIDINPMIDVTQSQ